MPSPNAQSIARFTVQSTNVSANQALDTGATAGVAVPSSDRHERVHFACDKNGAAVVDLYGYANYFGAGTWLFFDRITFSRVIGEVQQLEGPAAFQRLQAVVNSIAAGVYVLNVAFGFSE